MSRPLPAIMDSTRSWLAWVLMLMFGGVAPGSSVPLRASDDVTARVVILANAADPESMILAQTYAERREIPAGNVIALPLARSESISWTEFVETLHEPLQSELLRRGWVDGTAMDLRDRNGRRKIAVASHRIAYLVICRGVPLRIEHAPDRYEPVARLTDRTEFRTNGSAVDSELSLLAQSGYPINAFIPNPLFRNDQPTLIEQNLIVRVARLDGPTAAAALGLVDSALEAERTGLIGRAYVDTGGIHPDGDQWLESVVQQLAEAGYDLAVDRESVTLPSTARADAAAFYFGWYAPQINGPFALPGYRFAPGAIALHIHSFSAQSLRLENGGGWTGPLAARGVAAVFGNVGEPYLQLTHHPHLLLRALLRGWTLGEAAYYALPALSWQTILLGDPLYRPMRVSLDQQWAMRDRLEASRLPYLLLREANRLAAERRPEAARELLATGDEPAVALARARILVQDGAVEAAIRALAEVRLPALASAENWGLAAEVARQLGVLGASRAAVPVWRRLLAIEAIPPAPRLTWLQEAWRSATAAGDLDQATRWEAEIARLGGSVTLR